MCLIPYLVANTTKSLIHQVVVAFQANARQGTRAQKDREQVKSLDQEAF
jgi:large subunit ribosomal protein L4